MSKSARIRAKRRQTPRAPRGVTHDNAPLTLRDEHSLDALAAIPWQHRTVKDWTAYGKLLGRADRLAEQLAALRMASLLAPDVPLVLCNFTQRAQDFDREVEALNILRIALRADPTVTAGWHNLGVVARNLNLLDLAEASYRQAVEQSGAASSLHGLSNLLSLKGAYEESSALARRVLEVAPDDEFLSTEAMMQLGGNDLATGNLGPGFDAREIRLTKSIYQHMIPKDIPPLTRDTPASGHVLVWREQGIGDEVRFLSCIPDLLEETDHVTVRCNGRLARLVARSFPVEVNTSRNDVPENCTSHISIASLPARYRRSIDAFPEQASYLVPDPQRVAEFRSRLAAMSSRPKLGFSWRSRLLTNRRNPNYPDWDSLACLADLDGADIINLQYDHKSEELAKFASDFGVHIHHFDDLDLLDDLEGVTALCAALDGVLSVGNAVAELAGAVGTRTWQLMIAGSTLEFGLEPASAWHRNSTLVTRAWNAPWTDALADATQQIRAELLTAP